MRLKTIKSIEDRHVSSLRAYDLLANLGSKMPQMSPELITLSQIHYERIFGTASVLFGKQIMTTTNGSSESSEANQTNKQGDGENTADCFEATLDNINRIL